MRVVFMGTPLFAVPVLEMLIAHHEVVSVYSRPDRATGRGRHMTQTPVASCARDAGLETRQPETLRTPAVADAIRSDRPDVLVVAAYGAILPPAILDIPRHGCFNAHASLLPRWRGAAPVQRAILAGDAVTGVSIMRMEEGLDTGPWCIQKTVEVAEKTTIDLTADLAAAGATAMEEALTGLGEGSLVWHPQDDALSTYAAKVTKADVALTPDLTVREALARVRASSGSAPSRMSVLGRAMTVLVAHRADAWLPAGVGTCERDLVVGLADGAIRLDAIVPEGRSAMSGEAYIRGARLRGSCEWGAA
jgi:methionyl-tRNA formyltransferase